MNGSLWDTHGRAFDAALHHAKTCRACCVPIIVDDEGNPGFLGEACPTGRPLLSALLDAERALLKETA